MEYQSIAIIWVGLSLLVAGIAWLKNRSVATWLISALIFSPLITFLIIIFMSGVEKYEYTGEATLNNEAYKIYLTKQYHIEKIETIGKFQSQDKTFDKVYDALRYAQSIDRGIALEYLDGMDPIISSDDAQLQSENIITEKSIIDNTSKEILENKKLEAKIQSTGVVSKSSGGSGFLIGLIAILCLVGLFYFSAKNDAPTTNTLNSLESREDVSKYKIDGELAKAFNLNSKYTDVQRENLLKQIKGQLIIWEVEIYEVDKKSDKTYKIQTSGGLNIGTSDVGTFVELTAKDTLQSNFIEGLKTGQVIRIKGILTGESTLRSLIIKPAILWYPDDKKNDVQKSEAPSFIDGLKNRGEIFSISSDLKILIEKEEYVHIPGKQPGPYQCHLTSTIYAINGEKKISYEDVFGSVDPKLILESIKTGNKIESDESSLLKSIENIDFKILSQFEFILIDSDNVVDTCNFQHGPFKTDSIRPFFTELMRRNLQ